MSGQPDLFFDKTPDFLDKERAFSLDECQITVSRWWAAAMGGSGGAVSHWDAVREVFHAASHIPRKVS